MLLYITVEIQIEQTDLLVYTEYKSQIRHFYNDRFDSCLFILLSSFNPHQPLVSYLSLLLLHYGNDIQEKPVLVTQQHLVQSRI